MTSALHTALLNLLIYMKTTKGHTHTKTGTMRVWEPYSHFSCCGSYLRKEGIKLVHFHCVSHGNFNTVPHACTFHALLNITEFEVMKRGFCGSLFPFCPGILSHLSEAEAVTQDSTSETDSFPRTNTCWDRSTKSRPPLAAWVWASPKMIYECFTTFVWISSCAI